MNADTITNINGYDAVKDNLTPLVDVEDIDDFEIDDSFNYEGFQVVRGEFFAHIFEPSFTVDSIFMQFISDFSQGHPCKKHIVYFSYDFGFFRYYFRFAVSTFLVSDHLFVVEYDFALLEFFSITPCLFRLILSLSACAKPA